MTDNRLTPKEAAALDTMRQWFNSRTKEFVRATPRPARRRAVSTMDETVAVSSQPDPARPVSGGASF